MRSTSPLDKEYLYDSPKTPRSSSPFHFLYPIMPSPSSSIPSSSSTSTTPHYHSLSSTSAGKMGKRHSRRKEREAQEIARLLDPSYQGSSYQSGNKEGQRRSLEVFVDMDGDLHDPDFRYFPAAETFVSHTRERERRRSGGGGGGAGSPIRRRPFWEIDNEHALSDEEEEEEILARELGSTDFLAQAGHGNGTSASESSAMRSRRNNNRRDGSFSSYGFGYSAYSPSTHSYYSPTMTTSTLPTSYDSENTVLTNAAAEGLEGEKEKGVLKRRRREKEKEYATLLETTREEEKEDSRHGQREDDDEDEPMEQPDHVPTCTEALKRQWLSLSLRFRFGVYRSQRRFMRRIHSLF